MQEQRRIQQHAHSAEVCVAWGTDARLRTLPIWLMRTLINTDLGSSISADADQIPAKPCALPIDNNLT